MDNSLRSRRFSALASSRRRIFHSCFRPACRSALMFVSKSRAYLEDASTRVHSRRLWARPNDDPSAWSNFVAYSASVGLRVEATWTG